MRLNRSIRAGHLALPAALLAIALQILGPVSMVRMWVAALDPLGHATICQAEPDDAGRSTGHDERTMCSACLAASLPAVALIHTPAALPLPAAAVVATVSDPAQSTGPRGPPYTRPPARAPPAPLA